MPSANLDSGRLDIDPTYDEPVWLEGWYEVDPIPGGKRFQGCWLVLDDGTRYVIAYRPVPAHFSFLDKRVRIYGRPYRPGAHTQHIGAVHLEVQTIELAPGEIPYPTPPTAIPFPPVAKTADELANRDGRWVQVVGTLEWLGEDPEAYLGSARLRLDDGSAVQVGNVRLGAWAPSLGKRVTVTSRVVRAEQAGPPTFALVGWHAMSEGDGF